MNRGRGGIFGSRNGPSPAHTTQLYNNNIQSRFGILIKLEQKSYFLSDLDWKRYTETHAEILPCDRDWFLFDAVYLVLYKTLMPFERKTCHGRERRKEEEEEGEGEDQLHGSDMGWKKAASLKLLLLLRLLFSAKHRILVHIYTTRRFERNSCTLKCICYYYFAF